METFKKITNFIFNLDYWSEYKEYKKVKNVLDIFFQNEDEKLQKSFVDNFDYPSTMVDKPVRFEKNSGDIYYTLNFKSKEMFLNDATKEKALSNSLVILDKMLPLGVTQYIAPEPTIHIPDSFTLLCILKIQSDITTTKTILNVLGSIFKPLTILTFIYITLKYFIVF